MTNWVAQTSNQQSPSIEKYLLQDADGQTLTYRQFIDHLCQSQEFRSFVNQTLVDSSFKAFRFETPPVTQETFDRDFEFVLLEANYLDGRIDKRSFREHFRKDRAIVVFTNLSGKSPMIVPCPVGRDQCYGHLANFVRHADDEQTDEFWRVCGEEMAARINEKKLWLSTHGGGVAWLHMRIDSRPKYYGFDPYKNA